MVEMEIPATSRRSSERIVVRSRARVLFVEVDRIDWIAAEANYVRLHVQNESYLIRETMQAIEERLGSDRFVRIHRSHIVNVERVGELRLVGNGECEAVLSGGNRLAVSRSYRDKLQERLKSPD
jgi:two-component system, LytTR family, response regulator